MKLRVVIGLIFVFGIVFSSCNYNDCNCCDVSTLSEKYYKYEIAEFSIEQLRHNNNPDTNMVVIPNYVTDRYHQLLGIIYDNTGNAIRDEILSKSLKIRTYHPQILEFEFTDTCDWFENWNSGNLSGTGNNIIDSVIIYNKLYIDSVQHLDVSTKVFVKSHLNINGPALERTFTTFPNITVIPQQPAYNYYSDIKISQIGDIVTIIFFEGYGDCPNGCAGYHKYIFEVNANNCDIFFKGYIP